MSLWDFFRFDDAPLLSREDERRAALIELLEKHGTERRYRLMQFGKRERHRLVTRLQMTAVNIAAAERAGD